MSERRARSEIRKVIGVRGFLSHVLRKRQDSEEEWIFRGQREIKWDLVPKIDRELYSAYRTARRWNRGKHEDRPLTDFQKGARPHVLIPPENRWEWLAVAQHHGLATRLLDWTANPLAALFFAVEDPESDGDSAVWGYKHDGLSWQTAKTVDPFAVDEVTSFWPPHVTTRITVQAGCFTAHPESPKSAKVRWPGELTVFSVSRSARQQIRRNLAKIGVTRSALFPDLDGLAMTINYRLSALWRLS